tara:strand:- start:9025 stop:9237 length:213 start_codon:yes stop_codon:yes gene_type:complete
MFGFINSMIDETVKILDDVVDTGLAVVTLGEYGELNKENVTRLLAAGLTIYTISEVTGVAVDLIEKALED